MIDPIGIPRRKKREKEGISHLRDRRRAKATGGREQRRDVCVHPHRRGDDPGEGRMKEGWMRVRMGADSSVETALSGSHGGQAVDITSHRRQQKSGVESTHNTFDFHPFTVNHVCARHCPRHRPGKDLSLQQHPL